MTQEKEIGIIAGLVAGFVVAALYSDDQPRDDHGRFADGGGDSGQKQEDPIGKLWRQQAAKISTNKLKQALQDSIKFDPNPKPNSIGKLHQKIIREELEKRGVKIIDNR